MLHQLILNGTGGVERLPNLKEVDPELAEYGASDNHEAVWQVAFAQLQLQRAAQELGSHEVQVLPCPAESAAFCPAAAGQILVNVIEERQWKILQEALRILAFMKKRLHPMTLPAALSSLDTRYALYPHLQATVGERFRWLAAQNESWMHWLTLRDEQSESRGLSWPGYLWQSAQDVPEANAGLAKIVDRLTTTEKIRIADWAMLHPHPSFRQLLPNLLPSRSKILRRKVLNAVLQQHEHKHQHEINEFAQSYMSSALLLRQGQWAFKPSNSLLAPGLTFALSEVEHFADYFTNPLLRILALAEPLSLLPDSWEEAHIQQLLEDEQLERAAQIIICSVGRHRHANMTDILIKHFISRYPAGNTVGLRIDPLVQQLTTEQLRIQVEHLLSNPQGRFFEKLNMLLVEESPYLSRSHSATIIDRISEALTFELPHHEMINLDRLLPKLAYKLDSRIYPKVRSLWSDKLIFYGPLRKSFPFFQKKLERRHQILEAITLGG